MLNTQILATPKHTFLQLLQSLQNIALDNAGYILNPQDDINCIIETAKALQVRLGCMVAGVSSVLVHSQEATSEGDRSYAVHWITNSIGSFIQNIEKFISVITNNRETKWPTDASPYPAAHIQSVLVALPFLQNNSLAVSIKADINPPMLSLLSESIEDIVNLESTNLRVFSEQLMIAYQTGEISSEIDSALAYIAEWSGLIEGLVFIKNDADFMLSNITSKAA